MNNSHLHDIEQQYNQSIQFVNSHYENFPVISFLVPKNLRKHIAVIYQFARQADDIADEGVEDEDTRYNNLCDYETDLLNAINGKYKDGFWKILSITIKDKNLDKQNFLNLLKAFKQDTQKKSYNNHNELDNYCKNSANPVGRVILELFNLANETTLNYSDKICTALQLTNFYQDVSIDITNGRVYLPKDKMDKYNVTIEDLKNKNFTTSFQNLLKEEVLRTENLFNEGRTLLNYLPFRLKFQILVTVKGGEAILKKIKSNNYDVLNSRPKLSKMEFIKLFAKAILLRR